MTSNAIIPWSSAGLDYELTSFQLTPPLNHGDACCLNSICNSKQCVLPTWTINQPTAADYDPIQGRYCARQISWPFTCIKHMCLHVVLNFQQTIMTKNCCGCHENHSRSQGIIIAHTLCNSFGVRKWLGTGLCTLESRKKQFVQYLVYCIGQYNRGITDQ